MPILQQKKLLAQRLIKQDWKQSLKCAYKKPDELLKAVGLTSYTSKIYYPKKFKMLAPLSFVNKIKHNDINDPLLRQVIPFLTELQCINQDIVNQCYNIQPLEEEKYAPVPGLLHKYYNRALIITNGACAINCRYCFRRNFDYQAHQLIEEKWRATVQYIKQKPQLEEIILSGGDPFMLSDNNLSVLLNMLNAINHISYIRIHTRIPIVMPERITQALIDSFSCLDKKIIIIVHANHSNEIDEEVATFIKMLPPDIKWFNQSTLLKGVNDSAKTLKNLSIKLFDIGIMPYYLHVLDKVRGAQIFDISDDKAKQIYLELQAITSGYLVPKLAKEIPGNPNKTLL